MTHNPTNLSYFTNVLSDEGVFNIVVTVSLSDTITSNSDAGFTLTVINKCWTTVIAATARSAMNVSVLGGPQTQSWLDTDYSDTFSSARGDGVNICGPRVYTLDRIAESQLTMPTTNSIKLEATLNSEIAPKTCKLTITLLNYPVASSGPQRDITFDCNVSECVLTSFTHPLNNIPATTYIIGSVVTNLNLPTYPGDFSRSPLCDRIETYDVWYNTIGGALPSWITHDQS